MESSFEREPFDIKISPLYEVYLRLGAQSPLELSRNYTKLEQPLFIDGRWDYDDNAQEHNKIKVALESIGTAGLSDEEIEWRNEILWFWYHHAISVACRKGDKEKQRQFSTKALEYQSNNPNILTRTMYLLVHDKIDEAQIWVDAHASDADHETAEELLKHYKETGTL